ncbi:MAG TPA: DUF1080 domain-containing protein [Isosphaeraceae bacterium]|jgi:hypothetical protein
MRLRTARIAAALVVALAPAARAADEESKPLVRGTDPSQFELVGIGSETIRIDEDGVIHVSGKPNGYFATKDSYKNYAVSFEWMYERPEGLESDAQFNGNSGLLVHIQPPRKVWPRCIEVQLMNRDAGNIFAINGSKFSGKKDADAQKRAIKPVGQWNREEVVCKDGAITCTINGVEVATGTGASPDHGQIAWQSEGRPIRFRNLRIQPRD